MSRSRGEISFEDAFAGAFRKSKAPDRTVEVASEPPKPICVEVEVIEPSSAEREPDEPQLSCASAPEALSDDDLAALVRDGIKKFAKLVPYVRELRQRFAALPRGKAGILGCQTWEEFCRTVLDRTPAAVRKALAEKKTKESHEPSVKAESQAPAAESQKKKRTYTVTQQEVDKIAQALWNFDEVTLDERVAEPKPHWISEWQELDAAIFRVFRFSDKQKAAHQKSRDRQAERHPQNGGVT
jgi:hypothetical protein